METIKNTIECHSCKKGLNLEASGRVMRSDECPHCYANIHCCKMCDFYDKSAYNDCRESNADRILEKEMANFCDYFILCSAGKSGDNKKDDLLDAANSLFKS